MSDKQSRRKELKSLQMVRAFAALLVIVFHMQTAFGYDAQFTYIRVFFSAGYRGIDLFFVLSGFIIAYIHLDDLGRPERLSSYLFNRVARIYPAVWIMSILAIVMYSAGCATVDKLGKLVPTAIFASMFLLPQDAAPLVNVTWTLTYEIFFYALFSVLIVNVRLGLLLLLAWQTATAATAIIGWHPGLIGYYLRPICLEFGVGLVCAWWLRRFPSKPPNVAWVTLLAGGLVGFVVGMWLDEASVWAGMFCALGAGMIISALVRLEQDGRLYIPNFLVVLGGASYAIYLVHFSVIRLLSAILKRLGLPANGISWLICVAAGILVGLAFNAWLDRPIQGQLRLLKAKLQAQPV